MKQRIRSILVFGLLLAMTATADSPKRGTKPVGEGSKKLDFDGDVVEGMNRQPLDSLTSLSEDGAGGGRKYLYRRKKKAKPENRERAREIFETY